jgi:hypothetical protein
MLVTPIPEPGVETMNNKEFAKALADRIIKGLIVSGFVADAAKVIEGQRKPIEGSILRFLDEGSDAGIAATLFVDKLMLDVPVYAVVRAGGTLKTLLDYYTGALKALQMVESKMSKSPEFNAWDLGPSPALVDIRKALGKPTGEKK